MTRVDTIRDAPIEEGDDGVNGGIVEELEMFGAKARGIGALAPLHVSDGSGDFRTSDFVHPFSGVGTDGDCGGSVFALDPEISDNFVEFSLRIDSRAGGVATDCRVVFGEGVSASLSRH